MKWTSWLWAKSRVIIEILRFVVGSKPWLLLSGISPRGRLLLEVWFVYENDGNACVLVGFQFPQPHVERTCSCHCDVCGSLFLFFW